jgi:NAD-specific glutamate dehydrogenase
MFYRAIRWFIKNKKMQQSTLKDVGLIKQSVDDLRNILITRSNQLTSRDHLNEILSQSQLNQDSLKYLMTLIDLLPALDLHLLAIQEELSIEPIFHVYMKVGDILKLQYLEHAIENLSVHSEWDAWARNNMRDDLKNYQLKITHSILKMDDDIDTWIDSHNHILKDWDQICSHLESIVEKTYVEITVIIRMLERFL